MKDCLETVRNGPLNNASFLFVNKEIFYLICFVLNLSKINKVFLFQLTYDRKPVSHFIMYLY